MSDQPPSPMSGVPDVFVAYRSMTPPLRVSLLLGAWLLEPDAPPGQRDPEASLFPPGDWHPMTAWVGRRPVGSRLFTAGSGHELRKSSVFREPLRLAFWVDLEVGALSGHLGIDICAVPTRPAQLQELLKVDARCGGELQLAGVGDSPVMLRIGRTWVQAPDDVLGPVRRDDVERITRMQTYCDLCFEEILSGVSQQAAELLESIPGIGGEVLDPRELNVRRTRRGGR